MQSIFTWSGLRWSVKVASDQQHVICIVAENFIGKLNSYTFGSEIVNLAKWERIIWFSTHIAVLHTCELLLTNRMLAQLHVCDASQAHSIIHTHTGYGEMQSKVFGYFSGSNSFRSFNGSFENVAQSNSDVNVVRAQHSAIRKTVTGDDRSIRSIVDLHAL